MACVLFRQRTDVIMISSLIINLAHVTIIDFNRQMIRFNNGDYIIFIKDDFWDFVRRYKKSQVGVIEIDYLAGRYSLASWDVNNNYTEVDLKQFLELYHHGCKTAIALKSANIFTLNQLLKLDRSELLKIPGIGRVTVNLIEKVLADYNLELIRKKQ